MKLPRDLSGPRLAKSLEVLGYETTRQSGSHVRVTTIQNGEHHLTIPNHETLRVGTLAGILRDVSDHFQISRDELVERLFGR
jgi:predicted RNA binding protein YcfA (HicA-like mRNA interferase family)